MRRPPGPSAGRARRGGGGRGRRAALARRRRGRPRSHPQGPPRHGRGGRGRGGRARRARRPRRPAAAEAGRRAAVLELLPARAGQRAGLPCRRRRLPDLRLTSADGPWRRRVDDPIRAEVERVAQRRRRPHGQDAVRAGDGVPALRRCAGRPRSGPLAEPARVVRSVVDLLGAGGGPAWRGHAGRRSGRRRAGRRTGAANRSARRIACGPPTAACRSRTTRAWPPVRSSTACPR